MARQILIIPLGADHSAVITAELQRRQIQPDARVIAGALQVSPDDGVCRHAAGGAEDLPAGLPCRLHGPGHQRVADSLGEVPSQGRPVQGLPHLLGVVGQIHHRRLEAGEAHVQLRPLHMGVGQGVDTTGGLLGQLVHGPSAGIGQAQHPGRLVEALPRRVVPGGAQDLHVRVVPDVHDQGVAAGDGQGQEGRL